MKSYFIRRVDGKVEVEVHEESVDGIKSYPLKHVVRHSPDGFEFGYAGSGPSELARCILIDMGYELAEIDLCYHSFKLDFISRIDHEREGFEIYGDAVQLWWEHRHGRMDT